MNVLLLIAVLVLIYIADKAVCFIYCTAKKKQVINKRTAYSSDSKDGGVTNSAPNQGIKWVIKQLLYGWNMYSIERLGRFPFQRYRIFILRHIYRMDIDDRVVIYHGFHIRAPWNIRIGKGTVVGDGATLDGRNGLIIGENVNISTDVYIYTEQHDVNDPYFESGNSGGKVVVGNRAWLSSRTTVLPKVEIGEGAVLASGALATKDIEPYGIYGGVPCKKIGERTKDLRYEFDGSFIPFY